MQEISYIVSASRRTKMYFYQRRVLVVAALTATNVRAILVSQRPLEGHDVVDLGALTEIDASSSTAIRSSARH